MTPTALSTTLTLARTRRRGFFRISPRRGPPQPNQRRCRLRAAVILPRLAVQRRARKKRLTRAATKRNRANDRGDGGTRRVNEAPRRTKRPPPPPPPPPLKRPPYSRCSQYIYSKEDRWPEFSPTYTKMLTSIPLYNIREIMTLKRDHWPEQSPPTCPKPSHRIPAIMNEKYDRWRNLSPRFTKPVYLIPVW